MSEKTHIRICFHPRSWLYEFRLEKRVGNTMIPKSAWIRGDTNLEITKSIASDRIGNRKMEFTVCSG